MKDPQTMIDCPACNGEGTLPFSECCGAYMANWPDSDLCPDCKDHSGPRECDLCTGSGEIDPIAYKQFIEDSKEFNKD